MINKKIIIIFGMILLVAGVTYAAGVVLFGGNSHQDITDGLVLSMNLSQADYTSGTKTFTDDSSSKNNGVSANAATFTTDNYGKSNGSMSFNGGSDYVSLSTLPSLENISASFWVYPVNIGLNSGTWAMMLSSGASPNRFYFSAYNNKLEAYVGTSTLQSSTLYNNIWYLMTVTYNNVTKNASLYINGIYASSSLTNLTISPSFRIGGYIGGGYFFNGSISQIQIWNRALSSAEVQTVYNSSKPKMSSGSTGSGLIGYWPLDGDSYNSATNKTTDKTPYSNDGTNYGATLTTDRMGHSNGSMSFNGSGSYINCGNNQITGARSFTLSAWINTNNISKYSGAISIGESSGGQSAYIGTVQTAQLGTSNSIGGGFYGRNYGSGITTAGSWVHVALTFNSSNFSTLYVNGVAKVSELYNSSNLKNTYTRIGRIGSDTIYDFNGSIADVRIYNRALSATEIQTLYDSYKPKASAGTLQKGLILDIPLTSKWTKTETAGSQIMTDRTPYSNDGQNYGATVGSDNTSFDGNYHNITFNTPVNNIGTISFWMKSNSNATYPMSFVNTSSYLTSKWGYFSGDLYIRYVNGVSATETLGSEKLANTAFDSTLTGWAPANGASASWDSSTYVSSPGCAKITNPIGSQRDFYTSTYFPVTSGNLYKISFWAKANTTVSWTLSGSEWTTWANVLGSYAFNATTNWKQYSYYVYALKTVTNGYITFGGISTSTFILYVDDVSIKQVTSDSANINTGEWNNFVILPNSSLNASSLVLGQGWGGNFNGSISGLKIYNRALSTDEIKLLYDKGRQ